MRTTLVLAMICLIVQLCLSQDALKVVSEEGIPADISASANIATADEVFKNCEYLSDKKVSCVVRLNKEILGQKLNLNARYESTVNFHKKTIHNVVQLEKRYSPLHDKTVSFSELNEPQCFSVGQVEACLFFTDVVSQMNCLRCGISFGLRAYGKDMMLMNPEQVKFGDCTNQ
ncbi:pcp [Acrasis kona]|uniref:Pcp n=1 Tax=Acrasis kona TaxID=1008807 RepID=A0AAW2Z6H3_9EUKA